jgi:hypothetical protein
MTTGNLEYINFTGNNVGNTGNLLYLNDANANNGTQLLKMISGNTANTGNIMSLTSATAALMTNGIVRFNFTGNHTNNGFQLDDVTTTGTAMQVNVNNIIGGKGLAIQNAGTTLTSTGGNGGSMLDVRTTGAIAAFTGSLANISMTNAVGAAANNGTLLNISDAGAANTTKLLTMNSSSTTNATNIVSLATLTTTAPATGLVSFNFNGTRATAGTGFQITDASTANATVMGITANTLSTGTGLAIATAATGNNFTGNLESISVTGGSNLNNTGSLLNLNDANAADVTKLLTMTSGSTANASNIVSLTTQTTTASVNGIVDFAFNGTRTSGVGFQITDFATTAPTVMGITANALTTGTVEAISATGLTAGSTGSALSVTSNNFALKVPSGSIGLPFNIQNAGYIVASTDYTVLLNAAAAGVTYTLPNPAAANSGRILVFPNLSNQTLTLTTVGGTACMLTLASGAAAATTITVTAGNSATLQSNGANWYQISR